MPIVAHAHPFVIGVDTHARTHTLAILVAATGEQIATDQFPATDTGMDRAIAWAARRTDGDLAALWVIEGIATYGAQLASAVSRAGYEVVEAARMDARAHRAIGASPTPWTPAASPQPCCRLSLSDCAVHEATTALVQRCGS